MHFRLLAVASAAFFIAGSAFAQNAGTATNHAFIIGKGAGTTGYTSLLCGSAQLAVGQVAADPICKTITGDVTISAAGVTAIGTTKVTSAMLNADVFSTAHTWAGQQTFVAPILGTPASGTLTNATGLPIATGLTGAGTGVLTALGVNVGSAGAPVVNGGALGTPASGTLTNATGLPVSTGISGLGTSIATFLATPSSANLRAALTDEVGTGAAYFVGGALGTPASGTATNLTGLPLSGLAAQGAFTFVGNNTSGSAVPTAVDIATLTTKASPAAGDYVIVSDQAASGAWKKATVSSVGASSGVSSLNTRTGAISFSTVTQSFTSSGTYTPSTGMVYAIITCYGGGGGGGGVPTTSTGLSGAGGGGAGSKSIKTVSAATVGVSQTVTIGAAGAAGAAGASQNGTAGGDTSVGVLCVGKGGSGGSGMASANSGALGGAGGVAGTGDITGTGMPGSTGTGAAIQTVGSYTGAGGSTDIGGGAPAPVQTTGIVASGPGGGGSGGTTFSTAVAGGNGFKGYVSILEFIIN